MKNTQRLFDSSFVMFKDAYGVVGSIDFTGQTEQFIQNIEHNWKDGQMDHQSVYNMMEKSQMSDKILTDVVDSIDTKLDELEVLVDNLPVHKGDKEDLITRIYSFYNAVEEAVDSYVEDNNARPDDQS